MPATATKLEARQARVLHDADVAVKQLEAKLDDAKAKRAELFARYRDRVPLSDDATEAAKGIRTATIGGVIIRVAPSVSADSFSMKRYVDAGHAITAAMLEAIKPGRPYDRWTIKAAAGPKKLGAVEPT